MGLSLRQRIGSHDVRSHTLSSFKLVSPPLLDFSGMVGDDALVDYPHPRHACAVFKFDTTSHITHCPNCWYARTASPSAMLASFLSLFFRETGCPVPAGVARTFLFLHRERDAPDSNTPTFLTSYRRTLPPQVLLLRRSGALP